VPIEATLALPFEDPDSPIEKPSEPKPDRSPTKKTSIADAPAKQVGEGEGNESEDKGELPNFDEFELEDFPTTEEIEREQQLQEQRRWQQEEEEAAYERRARYADDEQEEYEGQQPPPQEYYEDDDGEYQDPDLEQDDGLEYLANPPPATSGANSEWMGALL